MRVAGTLTVPLTLIAATGIAQGLSLVLARLLSRLSQVTRKPCKREGRFDLRAKSSVGPSGVTAGRSFVVSRPKGR